MEIGADSDVLIHEATMEDGWEEEAAKKRHSTTSQAIKVGVRKKDHLIYICNFGSFCGADMRRASQESF